MSEINKCSICGTINYSTGDHVFCELEKLREENIKLKHDLFQDEEIIILLKTALKGFEEKR